MFRNTRDLLDYIALNSHTEKRDLEYKKCENWNSLKLKIVKAVLAMSNLEGGGQIIIGVVKHSESSSFKPEGMPKSVSETYVQDTISSTVSEYAEPHIEIELKHFSEDEKFFVVIKVFEFKEIPIICKKESAETLRGKIYCRSTRQIESTPDLTTGELREIIELAVDKGMIKQKRRVEKYSKSTVDKGMIKQKRRVEKYSKSAEPFKEERGEF